MVSRWREGRKNGESSVGTYTLPNVKEIANNLPYDSGTSNQGPVTAYRDWIGWEVGERFNRQGHMYTYD